MAAGWMCVEHGLGCQNTSPEIGRLFHINIGCILKYIQSLTGFVSFSIQTILQMSIRSCSQPYDNSTSLWYLRTNAFIYQSVWSYINKEYILYRIIPP